MVAHHDRDGRREPALLVLAGDLPVVARRHVQPELLRTLVHHPQVRAVVGPRVGVAHDRGHIDVGRRVHVVVAHDRELPQVRRLRRSGHVLDRGVGRRDDRRGDPSLLAPAVFETQRELRLRDRHPERLGAALTFRVDVRDEGELGDLAEQVQRLVEDRHRVTTGILELLQDGGDFEFGRVDRLVDVHDPVRLLGLDRLDETPRRSSIVVETSGVAWGGARSSDRLLEPLGGRASDDMRCRP